MLKIAPLCYRDEIVEVDGVQKKVEGVRRWSPYAYIIYFQDRTKLIVPNRGTVKVILSMILLIFLSALPLQSYASGSDDVVKERIVNCIIGEAEGEPYEGKLAVACAILNRVGTHGSLDKALRGVYGEHAPRVLQRKYSSKVFVDAVRAYEEMLDVGSCDFIDGADHWEGTKFPTPSWANGMKTTAVIGNQRFFRKGN